ncbi:Isoamyl acetate-hydrolyzing esterase 1-like protein [Smittium mucronatum]|uniref:Isoamyl acetate-hydrolyzing esterase 1-like protein n=1 Tax=Smittium mucronatum TaxID=133383 RepID=A0A1R0GL57_9FUNG|nr:Isoamyl acetate-hydrolyzing esterase 1-like protein [Smittium mucronatum]
MYTFGGFMNDVILAFGDSITQFGQNPDLNGWVMQLTNRYMRKLDVINRGFSGYNTSNGKIVLSKILPESSTESLTEKRIQLPASGSFKNRVKQEISAKTGSTLRLVLIFLGANDAISTDSQQYVSLEDYKDNLKSMIDLIKEPNSKNYSPLSNILLISPPPISECMWEKELLNFGVSLNKSNSLTKKYAQVTVEVGKEKKIPTIDLWNIFMDDISYSRSLKFGTPQLDNIEAQNFEDASYGFKDLLIDGLHLSKTGNDRLFELVVEKISECFPDINADNIDRILPNCNSILSFTE